MGISSLITWLLQHAHRWIEAKATSRTVVDNSAKAARSLFQFQRQMAGAARAQWTRDAANTQIQFAEDVTEAWAKAARDLLK